MGEISLIRKYIQDTDIAANLRNDRSVSRSCVRNMRFDFLWILVVLILFSASFTVSADSSYLTRFSELSIASEGDGVYTTSELVSEWSGGCRYQVRVLLPSY